MDIDEIDNKLDDLRKRWRIASPSMKKYLEVGGKLLKHKRELLEKRRLEKQTEKLF